MAFESRASRLNHVKKHGDRYPSLLARISAGPSGRVGEERGAQTVGDEGWTYGEWVATGVAIIGLLAYGMYVVFFPCSRGDNPTRGPLP
jgi:hypothetical protein